MTAPSCVFTIARAAELLDEAGRLWIYDTEDRAIRGFTERGIECLKELSLDQKR